MLSPFTRFLPARFRQNKPVVNVIRLDGVITAARGLQSGLSAKGLEPLLQKAFKKGVAAVALAINSPGGSPVQSSLIERRIRQLSAEFNVPVLAFCEDVAASGGYWLACAADEIFVDENSIVGSIGVISGGFGFPEALQKLGIERRIHTAGTSKSSNDPFVPEKPEDVAKLKTILEDMHQSFMALVRQRRGAKLSGDAEVFTGAYWTGKRALALGLVDEIGHLRQVVTERFGDKVQIRDIAAPKKWGLSRLGFGVATELPDAVLNALENRALWQRFGL